MVVSMVGKASLEGIFPGWQAEGDVPKPIFSVGGLPPKLLFSQDLVKLAEDFNIKDGYLGGALQDKRGDDRMRHRATGSAHCFMRVRRRVAQKTPGRASTQRWCDPQQQLYPLCIAAA